MKDFTLEDYQKLLKRKEEIGVKKLAEELGWSRPKLLYWLNFKSFLMEDNKKLIQDVKKLLREGYFFAKDIANSLMLGNAKISFLLDRNSELKKLLQNNLKNFLKAKNQFFKNLKRANKKHTCFLCKKEINSSQYYFRQELDRKNVCLECGVKKLEIPMSKKIFLLLKKINSEQIVK